MLDAGGHVSKAGLKRLAKGLASSKHANGLSRSESDGQHSDTPPETVDEEAGQVHGCLSAEAVACALASSILTAESCTASDPKDAQVSSLSVLGPCQTACTPLSRCCHRGTRSLARAVDQDFV